MQHSRAGIFILHKHNEIPLVSCSKVASGNENDYRNKLLFNDFLRWANSVDFFGYDSAFYKRDLKKNGVQLLSVLEQMDDSPESIILESVLEGMSEYYSKNLAREVMKGM